MNIKPLYTQADYQEVIIELMAYEAQGLLTPADFLNLEILAELADAFEAKHDPKHWYLQHRIHSK
jgi:hypothetical protein